MGWNKTLDAERGKKRQLGVENVAISHQHLSRGRTLVSAMEDGRDTFSCWFAGLGLSSSGLLADHLVQH